MKKIFFVLLVSLNFASYASGTIQITGHLRSYDATSIEVEDGPKIYKILKSKFPQTKVKELSNLKIDDKVTLTVPFDAVDDVRTKK